VELCYHNLFRGGNMFHPPLQALSLGADNQAADVPGPLVGFLRDSPVPDHDVPTAAAAAFS
jgi:hypothetical protein